MVCKKADIDMNKRAGELTDDEVTEKFCCLWFCEGVFLTIGNLGFGF